LTGPSHPIPKRRPPRSRKSDGKPANGQPMKSSSWPKVVPPLTEEQRRISDDFMKLWHEVLPKKFGIIEKFNHSFPVKYSRPDFKTTLEIGAGLGEHLHYEKLTPEQEEKMTVLVSAYRNAMLVDFIDIFNYISELLSLN